MRLLSGNPGMYQHSVEHTTEGETTQHEPEHGEDTIARVKGTDNTLEDTLWCLNSKAGLESTTCVCFCS